MWHDDDDDHHHHHDRNHDDDDCGDDCRIPIRNKDIFQRKIANQQVHR